MWIPVCSLQFRPISAWIIRLNSSCLLFSFSFSLRAFILWITLNLFVSIPHVFLLLHLSLSLFKIHSLRVLVRTLSWCEWTYDFKYPFCSFVLCPFLPSLSHLFLFLAFVCLFIHWLSVHCMRSLQGFSSC